MKAILITPATQHIEVVDVADLGDLQRLIGFDSIASDAVGTEGDRLYFDEECFLRGAAGRFRLDKLIPVAGKGVVVGSHDDGQRLRDAATDIDDLRRRITFLEG